MTTKLNAHLQVLCRTDGRWILYDDRLPPAKRTVGGRTFATAAAALAFAGRYEGSGLSTIVRDAETITNDLAALAAKYKP